MRTLLRLSVSAALGIFLATPQSVDGQSLRGSPSSVTKQYRTAHDHNFSFLQRSNEVHAFVENGYLVRLSGSAHYTLANVSYPYARPEVKLFIERLASQYRAACNERLVITSLTRPVGEQPRNASTRSVHPTGMAVDFRVSSQPTCRAWMENTLLSLERQGVIEATRERWPPHYHVAVFPRQYATYVAALPDRSLPQPAESVHYEVRRGDSLWSIARNYGIDVDSLRQSNNLASNQIFAGQTLRIPAAP